MITGDLVRTISGDPRAIERAINSGLVGGPLTEEEYWWLVGEYLTDYFDREAGQE